MAFDPSTARIFTGFVPVAKVDDVETPQDLSPPKTLGYYGAPAYAGYLPAYKKEEEKLGLVGTLLGALGDHISSAVKRPSETLKGAVEALPLFPMPVASQYGMTSPEASEYVKNEYERRRDNLKSYSEPAGGRPPDIRGGQAYNTGAFVSRMGQGLAMGAGAAGAFPALTSGFWPQVAREGIEGLPFVGSAVENAIKGDLSGTILHEEWKKKLEGMPVAGPLAAGGVELLTDLAINTLTKGVGRVAKNSMKGTPKLVNDVIDASTAAKAAAKNVDTPPVSSITDIPFGDINRRKVDSVLLPETNEVVDISKVKKPKFIGLFDDIPESEARILAEPKAPNTIPFDVYAGRADATKANLRVPNPQQLAGENATSAFRNVENLRKQAGEAIDKIIADNPDALVDISDIKLNYLQLVEDRLGKLIPGSVPASESGMVLAEKIGNYLLNLNDVIPADEARRLKQFMRDGVKFPGSSGPLTVNTGIVGGIEKNIASQIDKKLDDVLPGFAEANDVFSKINKIEERFALALGPEVSDASNLTKHGASIMKRAINSLADSNVSEIFRQVKEITLGNYDLFQDAAYASIAMKLSGDALQTQKALPFGGVISAMTGGGLAGQATKNTINLATKPQQAKRLKRVVDFYLKAQGDLSKKAPGEAGPASRLIGGIGEAGSVPLEAFTGAAGRTGAGALAGGTVGTAVAPEGKESEYGITGALLGSGLANAPQLYRFGKSLGDVGGITFGNLDERAGIEMSKGGYIPAILSPNTKKTYTNILGHKKILSQEIVKNEPDIEKAIWGELFKDNTGKYSPYIGFIDKNTGKFISRLDLENKFDSMSDVQKFRSLGQGGSIPEDLLTNPITRTGAGALAGGTAGMMIGDTPEERIENAFTGVILGGVAMNAPQVGRFFNDLGQAGSIDTWTKAAKNNLKSVNVKLGIVPEQKLNKYIRDVNNVGRIVLSDPNLHFEMTPGVSALKPNSDPFYKESLDFSTLCKKRAVMAATVEEAQIKLGRGLSSDEYLDIRKRLADKGYPVACGPCYVESRRMDFGKAANKMIEAYPDIQKEMFLTQSGIDRLRSEMPDVYKELNKILGPYGIKAPESRTAYNGEILARFANSPGRVIEYNSRSGLRWQSWSDFEIPHVMDNMQAVGDQSVVGLAAHAYTKVPEFVEVNGYTNMMINMSLIPSGTGLANGKLVFDPIEGMPFEEAIRLRNKFPQTAGTIAIGVNDDQIIKLMDSDLIDYIIPYHHSGLGAERRLKQGMNWADYTHVQQETVLDQARNLAEGGRITKSGKFNPIKVDWVEHDGDVAKYLELVKQRGLQPKFPQFINHPNYWKLLTDKKVFDNNGNKIVQVPLMPIFDMKYINKLLKDYKPDRKDAALDVVNEFIGSTNGVKKYYNPGITPTTLKTPTDLRTQSNQAIQGMLPGALAGGAFGANEDENGEFDPAKMLAMMALGAGSMKVAKHLPYKLDDMNLYSNAEKALSEISQNTAPGKQWAKMLDPSAGRGTKAEELNHLGLMEYLAKKGDQPVTKDELTKFVDENKLKLGEVRRGDREFAGEWQLMKNGGFKRKVGNRWSFVNPTSDGRAISTSPSGYNRKFDSVDEAKAWLDNNQHSSSKNPLKYQHLQLPGGENYREVLVTLRREASDSWKTAQDKLSDYYNGKIDLTNEEINALEKQRSVAEKLSNSNTYRSPHWDKRPNVLLHYRVNDRVVDGKKVLHVEEVQSDWHQTGRDKGYGEKGVPDAPFKKSWHELGAKRILDEANKGGYDKVSWTTGAQQAERYDLSKRISKVRIQKINDDDFQITAWDKNDKNVISNGSDRAGLPAMIGKELSEKAYTIPNGKDATYSGLDLEVGGEGMINFYDPEGKSSQNFAKSMQKLVKSLGGKGNIEQLDLGDHTVWSIDVPPKESFKNGMPMFMPLVGGLGLAGLLAQMANEEKVK